MTNSNKKAPIQLMNKATKTLKIKKQNFTDDHKIMM